MNPTLGVRLWALKNVPMIAYARPKIVAADDKQVVVRLPLGRRTKNHHGSMYFGALAVGADLAAGYLALQRIRASGRNVSFVFQRASAEFFRRPDADVDFVCQQGAAASGVIDKTLADGKRHAVDLPVSCQVAGQEVARFVMTLSVRAK